MAEVSKVLQVNLFKHGKVLYTQHDREGLRA